MYVTIDYDVSDAFQGNQTFVILYAIKSSEKWEKLINQMSNFH